MSDFSDGRLIAQGIARHVRENRDDQKRLVGHTVQLVKRNARGGIEVLNVRLHEGADPADYAEGKHVELVVDVSTFEGALYYRAIRPVKGETPVKPDTTRPAAPTKPQAA